MVCKTAAQAKAIAEAGARKMTAETHRIEGSRFRALYGTSYTITNLATGDRYAVSIDPKTTCCQCKFFKQNRAHGTCKHIEKCREEAAFEAGIDAQIAAMADYEDELAGIEAPAVPQWPSCWLHGPHEANEEGHPMSFCDRCESYL